MKKTGRHSIQTLMIFILSLLVLLVSIDNAWAKTKTLGTTPLRNTGSRTIEKPLKVTGQTRTLSMLLVLKNKKEKNDFVQVRQNYRSEILNTRF